jgi:hypothetical protein
MWPPGAGDYKAVMRKVKNSAPGPGGIPYAAYRAVADLAAPILMQVGAAMASGETMPLAFNACVAVFPPKGNVAGDQHCVIRSAGDTRPLSHNADNKLICSAYAYMAAPALRAGACPCQNGFVPGRQLGQNIVDLDAEGRKRGTMSMMGSLPTLAAFDYAAAFPSVSQEWLHFALQIIGALRDSVMLFMPYIILWPQWLWDRTASHSCIG